MAFAWSLRNVHHLEEGSESIFNAMASNRGQDHEARSELAKRHPPGAKIDQPSAGGPQGPRLLMPPARIGFAS